MFCLDQPIEKELYPSVGYPKEKSGSQKNCYNYYPFGMQTANSWTRENNLGNNFLANSGTELNPTSNLYDLDYRNYDPVLGRMNGVDPLATSFASITPYNYSFNDPVTFTDPSGAKPDDFSNPDFDQFGGCLTCYYNNGGDFGSSNLHVMDPMGGGVYSTWNPGSAGGYGVAMGFQGGHGLGGIIGSYNPDYRGPVYVNAPGSGGRWISPSIARWAYGQFSGPTDGDIQNLFSAMGFDASASVDKNGTAYVIYVEGSKYSTQRGKIRMQEHWVTMIDAGGDAIGRDFYAYFFDQESEAYQYMWDKSVDQQGRAVMEHAAFMTPNGILVLPTAGYNENGEFRHNGPRVSYNNLIPLRENRQTGEISIQFKEGWTSVQKQIHTHPNEQDISRSEFRPDKVFQNLMGIPVFVIRTDGFHNLDGRNLGFNSEFFKGSKSLRK